MKIDALPPSSADGSGSAYNFTVINDPKASFPSVRDQDNRDALLRWNLLPFMQAKCFRLIRLSRRSTLMPFSVTFSRHPWCRRPHLCALVQDRTRSIMSASSVLLAMLRSPSSTIGYQLRCCVSTFSIGSRTRGFVRAGDIAGCFDVPCGDILVSDRLRKMILDESSEEWELYSEQERNELIFHVMKRLAVGGGMNQYDNQFQPYLDITKKLYKDLVTVSKSAAGALQVSSITYEIESVSGTNQSLSGPGRTLTTSAMSSSTRSLATSSCGTAPGSP